MTSRRITFYNFVTAAIFIALGAVAGRLHALWPVPAESYTVRLKAACVAKEGVPVQFNYVGRGSVQLLIVPPDAAPKGQKETK